MTSTILAQNSRMAAWWNDEDKQLWLVELTVSFETSFEGASQRKETKYEDIVAAARESGYKTTLITVEVGSRGVPHMPGFKKLSQTLHLSRSQLTNLLHGVARLAVDGSFRIWANRNRTSLPP